MQKKFAFLLIDANIIIEAFRVGVWQALVNCCDIYLPEVMLTEALYYRDSNNIRHQIDLNPYCQSGMVTVLTVELSATRTINLSRWIIPQIPGSKPRSKPVRGVFESLVRSKKYVVPLAVFQPFATGSVAAGYVFGGRFDPKRNAESLSSPLAVRAAFGPSLAGAENHAGTNEPDQQLIHEA